MEIEANSNKHKDCGQVGKSGASLTADHAFTVDLHSSEARGPHWFSAAHSGSLPVSLSDSASGADFGYVVGSGIGWAACCCAAGLIWPWLGGLLLRSWLWHCMGILLLRSRLWLLQWVTCCFTAGFGFAGVFFVHSQLGLWWSDLRLCHWP